jgi:hypothetical protein
LAARRGLERNTVAGTFTALKESLANLLSSIGDKLSSVIVPVLNTIKGIVDWLSNHPALVLGAIGANTGSIFGPIGAAIGGLIGLGIGSIPNRKNAAAQIGTGRDRLATEGTLAKIEQNTAKLPDALVRAVLGGPGTVARGAATARDVRLAFAI